MTPAFGFLAEKKVSVVLALTNEAHLAHERKASEGAEFSESDKEMSPRDITVMRKPEIEAEEHAAIQGSVSGRLHQDLIDAKLPEKPESEFRPLPKPKPAPEQRTEPYPLPITMSLMAPTPRARDSGGGPFPQAPGGGAVLSGLEGPRTGSVRRGSRLRSLVSAVSMCMGICMCMCMHAVVAADVEVHLCGCAGGC